MTEGTQHNLVMLTVVIGVRGKNVLLNCHRDTGTISSRLHYPYCVHLVVLVSLVETGVAVTKSTTELHYSILVFHVNTEHEDHKKNCKFLL